MHGKKPRLCPKTKQNESWWEDQQTYVTYIFTEIDSLFNVVFVCNSCPKVCAKNLNSVKGTSQSKEMDVSNTFMQIQKQCALYKGWPGAVRLAKRKERMLESESGVEGRRFRDPNRFRCLELQKKGQTDWGRPYKNIWHYRASYKRTTRSPYLTN